MEVNQHILAFAYIVAQTQAESRLLFRSLTPTQTPS